MEFLEYLKMRHEIKPGIRPLSEVSAEQYDNRLHNLKRRGIYNDELELTNEIRQEIEKAYKNGLTHYPRAVQYYIEFLEYKAQMEEKYTTQKS